MRVTKAIGAALAWPGLLFVACTAASACRLRTASFATADASRTIALNGPDGGGPAVRTGIVIDAATNRTDAAIDVPHDAISDASRPDTGTLLINAAMGAFSIGRGTRSGRGYGADARDPHVYANEPTVTGPLDDTSVHVMLNAGQRYFRDCYLRGLQRDRHLGGTAVVRVVIGPTGDVTTASATQTTLADRDVASCVASIFLRSRFAASRNGASAIVTVPFSFEPGTP